MKRESMINNNKTYFRPWETIFEGNPQQILDRREAESLPPLLIMQVPLDDNVLPSRPGKFARSYRAAGGECELHVFEGCEHEWVAVGIGRPQTDRAHDMVKSVHRAESRGAPGVVGRPTCMHERAGNGLRLAREPAVQSAARADARQAPSRGLPEGDGWLFEPKWDGFRALVFRDGDEVYLQSRDSQAAEPLLPRAGRAARARAARALRARRRDRDRRRRRARLRGAAAAHPPGRVAREAARRARSPASFVAWDLLALGDEDLRARRSAERRARLESLLAERRAAGAPDAGDARPRARRGLVPALRGRGPRRRDGQAPRRAPTCRASARCSRSSTRARPTASSPASAGTRTARARWSARCCSACTTTTARCTTSASPRRSRNAAQAARRGAGAAARERARRPPVARLGRGAIGGERDGAAHARRDEPLEPRQGPDVGAAAARARLRGRVRPHAGRSLPPRARTSCAGAPTSRREDCRYDQLEVTPAYELERVFGLRDVAELRIEARQGS